MTVSPPTPEQVAHMAEGLGLTLAPGDVATYADLLAGAIGAYQAVHEMPDNLPEPPPLNRAWSSPDPAANAHNAWYCHTHVRGSREGRLSGRTVALKDNIMLAGVPMMNGSATLEGYIPDVDATVAARVLDAGATIAGKAHCECFCLSGGSHTGAAGPVHNPYRRGYSAGGSSSGCAVLVALGEVDMAIGCDQGGSIRMPSSFCGTHGMKPTYGLVPYTGIIPIEIHVDHVGPITANVADNALLLEILAGEDGLDPRQRGVQTYPYTQALGQGVAGLRIGVVREGFGRPEAEPDVEAKVRAAARLLCDLGAEISEISIPWHKDANSVWMPIGVDGLTHTMLYGDGFGASRSDLYVTSLMDAHRGWRQRVNELPPTIVLFLLLGTYIRERYGTRYYGKAMNISRRVRAAYDAALTKHDLLLMPTTPMKATPLPPPAAGLAEYIRRANEPTANTMPFDITHHPAMSLPCGMSDGLPVGMMLIARHWHEATIYRAAHAFEQAADWRGL